MVEGLIRGFYFYPSMNAENGKQILSLKANISKNQYLEFIYSDRS